MEILEAYKITAYKLKTTPSSDEEAINKEIDEFYAQLGELGYRVIDWDFVETTQKEWDDLITD